MLDWFKRLFGLHGVEAALTLAERHAKANEVAEGAISLFNGIVEDLETAALDLKEIAQAAAMEAATLMRQVEVATNEATKNEERAAKIRSLLD